MRFCLPCSLYSRRSGEQYEPLLSPPERVSEVPREGTENKQPHPGEMIYQYQAAIRKFDGSSPIDNVAENYSASGAKTILEIPKTTFAPTYKATVDNIHVSPITRDKRFISDSANPILLDSSAPSDAARTAPLHQESNISSGEQDGKDLLWTDLIDSVVGTDFQPMKLGPFCEGYASEIYEGYELTHVEGTQYIWHHGTDSTICLCEEGVFSFGLELESCYLISRTIRGALRYIETPGVNPEGPQRDYGSSYFE